MRGPWPPSLLDDFRIMHKEFVHDFLCRPRATGNEVGAAGNGDVFHSRALFVVFVGLLLTLVILNITFRLVGRG